MSEWIVALVLKPLVSAVVFGLPTYAIKRYIADGWLKRVLLLEIHDDRRYTVVQSWRALRTRETHRATYNRRVAHVDGPADGHR